MTQAAHIRRTQPLRNRLLLGCTILCISLPATSTAPATPLASKDRTFETQLDNGLKIIVREDHRAPVMVSQVWYRVGSSYETAGQTGLSHILEHMLFKGTPKVPTGEFSKLVAQYGGSENAFTSYDYTGYYQVMQANNLPLSLELEADRMRNALLPEDEFKKELQVVIEERRLRTEDNPSARTYERFTAAAYLSSGYHNPIIGWMHDLKNMKLSSVRDWYETWYAPNNAILVVVGDVKHQQVFDWAKKFFGPLKPSVLPERQRNIETASLGTREVNVNIPAKVPTLYMGYNVPGINTAKEEWEVYALTMLVGVLDGGYSARIETDIIRQQQIAANAGAGYNGNVLGDSLFFIQATPAKNASLDAVQQALEKQLKRLQDTLASETEMARVRAQVISQLVYQQDSISSQANQIGRMAAIGRSWRDADTMVEKLEAITPAQVQAVAKKYLIPERLTIARLIPTEPSNTQSKN